MFYIRTITRYTLIATIKGFPMSILLLSGQKLVWRDKGGVGFLADSFSSHMVRGGILMIDSGIRFFIINFVYVGRKIAVCMFKK